MPNNNKITWTPDKIAELSKLRASGLTLLECGKKIGVSAERVRQVLNRGNPSATARERPLRHHDNDSGVPTITKEHGEVWSKGFELLFAVRRESQNPLLLEKADMLEKAIFFDANNVIPGFSQQPTHE